MNHSIIIKYQELQPEIRKTLPTPPKTQYDLYTIFLSSTPISKDKLTHQYTYYVICKGKDLCELSFVPDYNLNTILNLLRDQFPSNMLLWASVSVSSKNFLQKLQLYVNEEFHDPYITTKSPLEYHDSDSYRIALTRKNNAYPTTNNISTYNQILYITEQSRKPTCSLTAYLTKDAVTFLKKLPHEKSREITGKLHIRNIRNIQGEIVYEIDVDKDTIVNGESENVDVTSTKYNFHSHPKSAYINHNVKKAWPSCTDYLGFLKLRRTIFHCVVTLEGLYIISFGPYWSQRLNKVNKQFIRDNYDIDHKESYTPQEYVKHVNRISHNNHPIFHVIYIPWNKSGEHFSVSFAKKNNNCVVSD